MNIDEYTEKVYGIKLHKWQKELLKKLKNLPPNSRVVFGRYGRIYIVDGSKESDRAEREHLSVSEVED